MSVDLIRLSRIAIMAAVLVGADAARSQAPESSAPAAAVPGAPFQKCFDRLTDDRPSTASDDKIMTIWLTVPQKATVAVRAYGYANGARSGTLRVALYNNGIPIGQSTGSEGPGEIRASGSAQVIAYPGRQYKLTAKPVGANKTFKSFEMHVAINRSCP